MAAVAAGVGRLEEEALRRKERLKALREKTGRKDKEDGEPKTKQLREEEEEGEKHRTNAISALSASSGALSGRKTLGPSERVQGLRTHLQQGWKTCSPT